MITEDNDNSVVESCRGISLQGSLVSDVICAHVVELTEKEVPFSMAIENVELVHE